MKPNNNYASAIACGALAAVLALTTAASPVLAADPIFPVGSRVGLVPPAGMVATTAFDGFADPSTDAAIIITVLPAAAYAQMEKIFNVETLKKGGVTVRKREAVQFEFGKGFLLTGQQVVEKAHYRKWLLVAAANDLTALVSVQVPAKDNAYSDRAVRAALGTLALRVSVPEAEELSLLPFAVGDLAGFHIDGVVRGRALMLSDPMQTTAPSKDVASDSHKIPVAEPAKTDASKDSPGPGLNARFLIAAMPGGPQDSEDHDNFARLSFGAIGGIHDIQITMSEPLRIGGQSGYQTMARAKDARTGGDVMVVQWLRFGNGGYLQMIGIARTDVWTSVLARLRAVRDSVDLR